MSWQHFIVTNATDLTALDTPLLCCTSQKGQIKMMLILRIFYRHRFTFMNSLFLLSVFKNDQECRSAVHKKLKEIFRFGREYVCADGWADKRMVISELMWVVVTRGCCVSGLHTDRQVNAEWHWRSTMKERHNSCKVWLNGTELDREGREKEPVQYPVSFWLYPHIHALVISHCRSWWVNSTGRGNRLREFYRVQIRWQ